MADFVDESGTTRLRGTLTGLPASGIPQGGPLTMDLLAGGHSLAGADSGPVGGAKVTTGNAGGSGGIGVLRGGDGTGFVPGGDARVTGGANGPRVGASVSASGATNADAGRVAISSGGVAGLSGQVLVPDGAGSLVYGGVSVGSGIPVGASAGSLPFAFDTTAVTGGFYFWNGAAWVKIAAIL